MMPECWTAFCFVLLFRDLYMPSKYAKFQNFGTLLDHFSKRKKNGKIIYGPLIIHKDDHFATKKNHIKIVWKMRKFKK